MGHEMGTIDFWFSIGSTYSYLSVMRISNVAKEAEIEIRWRPFNVRRVMGAQNNIQFKDKPVKTAYMWRDIERRAQSYGLAPSIPAPYPLPELVFANQVAMLGAEEGWVEAYTRATYQRWFQAGQLPGEEPNLSQCLSEIGLDPIGIKDAAGTDRIAAKLDQATSEAMAVGIFGSPCFAVGTEIFWGDDRLDDAIEWALKGR
jgi:2-hydroxychromene-2-carboxylate isomerase